MKLLVFSDIHGDKSALEKLMEPEADYSFAAGDLGTGSRGLERAGPILKRRADRMYVLPGNHESERDIAGFCADYGFRDFHGKTMQAGGFTIAGLGYSSPTPFLTPGEYSEEELAEHLATFAGLQNLILICHCPPKGTPLDLAGGMHLGSTAVKDFLDREQPEYFFCGH